MNRYLQQLIEVAEIDKKIDSFEPRIAEAKFEVNQMIKQKDKLANEITLLEDDHKEKKHKEQKTLANEKIKKKKKNKAAKE
ncbi:MAG: hypothetical protein HDT11_02340, partial [Helicobacter sp.]|nr:hypothetical protein [Helicobacter sp.]